MYSICAYCVCDLNDNRVNGRERVSDFLKNDDEVFYYDIKNKKWGQNKENPVEPNPDPEKRGFLKNSFK